MRLRCLLVMTGVALTTAGGIGAQTFNYCAFGDSITCGKCDNDQCFNNKCENQPVDPLSGLGYPGRLRNPGRLDCAANNCEVYNYGKPGEQTNQGVTRIDSVLTQQNFDVVLLMEGTNDIFHDVSRTTINANLQMIEDKAANAGVDTVYASIIRIHPDGRAWSSDHQDETDELHDDIEALAPANGRWFADPWAQLCHSQTCFNNNYATLGPAPPDPDAGDNGLHPKGSGYAVMADQFLAGIQQHSVPPTPVHDSPADGEVTNLTTVKWQASANATWYQLELDGGADVKWLDAQVVCQAEPCSFTQSLTEGSHTWRLRARNPRGRSGWSASRSFTYTMTDPAAPPTPLSPVDDTFDQTPLFRWTNKLGAEEYRIEIDGSPTTVAADVCDATTCSWEPASDLSIGQHDWRVRALYPLSQSNFSTNQDFAVLDCPPNDNLNLQMHTVTGGEQEAACDTITAGNSYVVAGPNGELGLHAGQKIALRDGFVVEAGGELRCRVDP